MKILSAEQIHELDKYTIENEPVASIDLMERAAAKVFDEVSNLIKRMQTVFVFCGMGNNGGDGLAVARMLVKANFHDVRVFVIRHSPHGSADFDVNEQRLKELLPVNYIDNIEQFPSVSKDAVVIDAIFGSGLSRPVEGLSAEVINAINASGAKIYAIDLPSGLFCDSTNGTNDVIINSTCTFTFHAPKLTFLLPQNEKYVPQFKVLDIGLNAGYQEQLSSNFEYIEASQIASVFKPRSRFSHKGTYGHLLVCAGSYGKMGAAILSVSAALRSGTGLVTANIAKCGYNIMQSVCPEAMVEVDKNENALSTVIDFTKLSALAVGPGIGMAKETVEFVEKLLKQCRKPLVLDADALNVIAERNYLKEIFQPGTILTPHPGEFKRLVGVWENDLDKLKKQSLFAVRHKVVLVLKGANTSIATPDGKIYFNSTGNPGMAKGGSGDVLTGVIGSLLAQGYEPKWAAIIGVYIHGLAGDEAAKHMGQTGITARDIVRYLPTAFSAFE